MGGRLGAQPEKPSGGWSWRMGPVKSRSVEDCFWITAHPDTIHPTDAARPAAKVVEGYPTIRDLRSVSLPRGVSEIYAGQERGRG